MLRMDCTDIPTVLMDVVPSNCISLNICSVVGSVSSNDVVGSAIVVRSAAVL